VFKFWKEVDWSLTSKRRDRDAKGVEGEKFVKGVFPSPAD